MIFNHKLPKLIGQLNNIVQELEKMFPNRKFTLDGCLVGSLGEVWAANKYDFELFKNSHEKHDAQSEDGKLIQIKTTQRKRIALSSCPNYLLVLHLDPKNPKLFEEIYYGDGKRVWKQCGKQQKNGQRPISFSKIKQIKI
jgi:hypothetical protein